MPPASRVPEGKVDAWSGWATAYPLKHDPNRLVLSSLTISTTRRSALRAWQALFPRWTWRGAYRKGWRVLRVKMEVATGSLARAAIAPATEDDPSTSGTE